MRQFKNPRDVRSLRWRGLENLMKGFHFDGRHDPVGFGHLCTQRDHGHREGGGMQTIAIAAFNSTDRPTNGLAVAEGGRQP